MSKGNGVYVATESFSTVIDGEPYVVHAKKTRVREGHPLLERNRDYFKPIEEDVTYDLETADKPPKGGRRGPKEKGDKVVVPDGVVPGETPGWPVDGVTGEPLDLTSEEREALTKAALERGDGDDAGAKDDADTAPVVDLSEKTRKELDEIASDAGVENPAKLSGGKAAVIAAIEAAQKPGE